MGNVQTLTPVQPETKRKAKYTYSEDLPPLRINLTWCKTCNICIELCPKKVLGADANGKPFIATPDACTQCASCWMHCPDFAITSNYR